MKPNSVLKVIVSCCLTSFLMEIVMAKAPHSAIFLTFLQFVFCSIHGFIFTTKFGTVNPKVPVKHYALLVSLFFITSMAVNYTYSLHVPSTLHMIIRSASSPASMFVSWYAKNRAPKLNNALGSILITIGVILATYGGSTIANQNEGTYFYWCVGVAILMASLVTGAFTGLQQEILFSKYGKHPEEFPVSLCYAMTINKAQGKTLRVAGVDLSVSCFSYGQLYVLFSRMLFYTYMIPLPLFLAVYPQLWETATTLSWDIWFFMALNILSHFYCIHSVHVLATNGSSVNVTFILTLRKFISLLISAIVFKNYLTYLHVLGTIFVIFGAYIYFDYFKGYEQKPVNLKSE